MDARPDAGGTLPRATIEAAAARGDPGAQLLLAEQLAGEGNGDAAVVWLARAAKDGHAQSFALLGAWQVLGYYVERQAAEGVQRLEIAARHGEDTAAGRRESEEPRIDVFEAAVSTDACRYVMGVAAAHLQRARVNEPHRGRGVHEMRTNSDMTIGPTDGDPLLQILNERIARMARLPVTHQEDTTVLRYRPGEVYDDHFDWFNPAVPEFRDEIADRGQRVATALIYLSDGYEGGETEFPAAGYRFKGRAGDAIVWRNVRPDGAPEPRALHAGRPPASGEKWVLSKWIRGKPQAIVTPRRARP